MEKCLFFNDVDNDRVYFAEDFAEYFAPFFTNGIFNNGCKVSGENSSMSVSVSKGLGFINGYRYINDRPKVLTIENADGVLSRIDNIVIRWTLPNRDGVAQVIKGSFSENPVAPPLVRTSTTYDLRIAKVSIPAGTTTITQDLITDTRFNSNDCGNVVGAVQQIDTTDIFNQYDTMFINWFNSVKDKLSGDLATSLQNQIDELIEKHDNDIQEIEETNASLNDKLGQTSNLQTTSKVVVGAINENKTSIDTMKINTGEVSTLKTTSKKLVGAINEVHDSIMINVVVDQLIPLNKKVNDRQSYLKYMYINNVPFLNGDINLKIPNTWVIDEISVIGEASDRFHDLPYIDAQKNVYTFTYGRNSDGKYHLKTDGSTGAGSWDNIKIQIECRE